MPYVEHPDVFLDVPDTAVVWRYMDFAKFVAMLEDGALHFANVSLLQRIDPFEGALSEPVVQYIRSMPLAMEPAEAAPFREHMIQTYRALCRQLHVSCWHQNDGESAAMWNLYATRQAGIAVRSTVGNFKAALARSSQAVRMGGVRYVNYGQDYITWDNPFSVGLHKGKGYEHEREIRGIVDGPIEPAGIKIEVSLPELVQEVWVAPTCEPWFEDLVRRQARRHGLNPDIQRSRLTTSPSI